MKQYLKRFLLAYGPTVLIGIFWFALGAIVGFKHPEMIDSIKSLLDFPEDARDFIFYNAFSCASVIVIMWDLCCRLLMDIFKLIRSQSK